MPLEEKMFLLDKVLIIFITFLVTACSSPSRNSDVHIPINDPSEVFVRDVPENQPGKTYYAIVSNLSSQLKLDKLDSGFNDLQIRIWLGHSLAIHRNIVILKKVDANWYAQLVTFTTSNEERSPFGSAQLVKFEQDVFPKSGWDAFLTQLNQMKIFDSLYMGNVSIQKGCVNADGMSYDFELATPSKYRFQHHCYADEYLQKFTLYLEKEFEFEFTK